MVIPGLFKPTKEFTVNYNWIDVVTAAGYVLFDGASFPLTATVYSLIPSSIATTVCTTGVLIEATCTSSNWTKLIYPNYDSSALELPKTIKGLTYVALKWDVKNTTGNPGETESYAIIRLMKGAVELASAQTVTYNSTVASGQTHSITSMLVFDTPLTHFKKGEQIRLTVEIWGDKIGGDNMKFRFNPIASGTTRLMCALPHRLDYM